MVPQAIGISLRNNILLGLSTNNLVECQVVIGLLMEALASDVREIRVYLDFELVVQ